MRDGTKQLRFTLLACFTALVSVLISIVGISTMAFSGVVFTQHGLTRVQGWDVGESPVLLAIGLAIGMAGVAGVFASVFILLALTPKPTALPMSILLVAGSTMVIWTVFSTHLATPPSP